MAAAPYEGQSPSEEVRANGLDQCQVRKPEMTSGHSHAVRTPPSPTPAYHPYPKYHTPPAHTSHHHTVHAPPSPTPPLALHMQLLLPGALHMQLPPGALHMQLPPGALQELRRGGPRSAVRAQG